MGYVIRVMHYETHRGFVEFNIRVSAGREGVWFFCRRYSLIRQWHDSMMPKLGPLPTFPAKRWCGRFDPEFLAQRERDLEEYLAELTNLRRVTSSDLFQSFIQPADSVYLVNPIGHFTSSVEAMKSIFKSTEGRCKKIVQDTANCFVDMGELPSPIEEADVRRRDKEIKKMLEKEKVTVEWRQKWDRWDAKKAVGAPVKRPYMDWFESRVEGLIAAFASAEVPDKAVLAPV